MRAFPLAERPEFRMFRKLNTPAKIQDFLNAMPINFERKGETCRSPLMTLRHNEAHCMEGALLAAAILWSHGERPLLLDLKTSNGDDDHVITLFKEHGRWGAIGKTNHAVLRYRDPIFKTIRELVLSFFNEYFLDNRVKTLRSYSAPFSLLAYKDEWLDSEDPIWAIPDDLDASKHFPILRKNQKLRLVDPIEIEAGNIAEWKANSKKGT
jgi:hypothetical protein